MATVLMTKVLSFVAGWLAQLVYMLSNAARKRRKRSRMASAELLLESPCSAGRRRDRQEINLNDAKQTKFDDRSSRHWALERVALGENVPARKGAVISSRYAVRGVRSVASDIVKNSPPATVNLRIQLALIFFGR
jgi:hypothetical protein